MSFNFKKIGKNKRCCLNCTYLSINYYPNDSNSDYTMPNEKVRSLYRNDISALTDLQTKSGVKNLTENNEYVKCHHEIWNFNNKPYFGLFEKGTNITKEKNNTLIFKERSKILKKRRLKGSCPFNHFNSYQSLEGALNNMEFRSKYKEYRFNKNKEYVLLIVTVSTLLITIFNTFLKEPSTIYFKLLK